MLFIRCSGCFHVRTRAAISCMVNVKDWGGGLENLWFPSHVWTRDPDRSSEWIWAVVSGELLRVVCEGDSSEFSKHNKMLESCWNIIINH